MAAAAAPTSIYWVGQDGNAYVKGPGGNGAAVTNAGTAHGTGAMIVPQGGTFGFNGTSATRVADPNAPTNQSPAPAPANSNGSGKAAPAFADKSGDISLQNGYLGSADANQASGIDAINANLGKILGGYGTETAANEGNYTNESNSNTNSLQSGKQTALVNAARGRQGLLATLSSIGALSGDSINLANEAVQHGANTDLTGATNTFATNQSALDQAIGTYRRENQNRIDSANNTATDDIKNTKAQTLQGKQTAFAKLADDYAAQGDAAQSKSYGDQAASLYPQLVPFNTPSSNFTPAAAAYTAPTLASYLGNTGGTNVTTTPAPGNTPGTLPSLSAINNLTGKKQTSGLMVA